MDLILRDKFLSQHMNNPACLQQVLIDLSVQTVAECRQKEHWLAKVQMLEGNYQGAVARLSLAMMKYGPHMGLRIDLATCYYLMGVPRLYEKTLYNIEADYFEILPQLHPINQVKTSLMMGKLLEERGRMAAASKIYKNSIELIEQEVTGPTWLYDYAQVFLRFLAQILRFSVQFEFVEEAHRSFRMLQQSQQKEITLRDAQDDIVHAVHLYHLRFTQNYDYKISMNVSDRTRQLCIFETVEMKLRQQIDQNTLPDDVAIENSYDRALMLLNNQSYIELNSFLTQNTSELSTASLIRIVMLTQHIKPGLISPELTSLVNAILLDLSEQDRQVWRRWIDITKSDQLSLTLYDDTLVIKNVLEVRKINLQKKKMIKHLLKCLSQRNEWAWEEIVEELWGIAPDLSAYDRLRMLVARTNDLISASSRKIELRDYKLCTNTKVFFEGKS